MKVLLSVISTGITSDLKTFGKKFKKMKKIERAKSTLLLLDLIAKFEFLLNMDKTLSTNEISEYKKENQISRRSLEKIIDGTKKPDQLWNLVLSEWNEKISEQMNQLDKILK